MGFTSEQVHWMFGVVIVATGMLLLLRHIAGMKGRWLDYVVPTALAIFGTEFALDPLVHGEAMPTNYAAEMTQHFIVSVVLLGASAAEFVRLARSGQSFAWRLPLVAALVVTAGIFALHAQHGGAPMLLLMTQHRMIAATLAVAALAVLLEAITKPSAHDRNAPAFPLLTVLLGVQLLVYTEGTGPLGMMTQ
ncbi:hypothetical protein PV773_03235 [Mesorhizobium sp. CC13]|uniref:hypothetical protein n=1 Tax=Mesorhizobium sp. CC13 TaxID=3029194 RepID=UPI0032651248